MLCTWPTVTLSKIILLSGPYFPHLGKGHVMLDMCLLDTERWSSTVHPDSNAHHTNVYQSDLGEPSPSLRHILISHSQSCPSAHRPNRTDAWRHTTPPPISNHVVTKIIATPREKTITTQNHTYRHMITRNTITQAYNYTDKKLQRHSGTQSQPVTVAQNRLQSTAP